MGPTELPDVSRMTVVVDVDALPLEQVTKQLNKLVEVLKVVEIEPQNSIQRQIVLVKVRCDTATRGQIIEIAQLFRGKVVDVTPEAMSIEATGNSEKIRDFLALLEPYGIKELVQSGIVALGRGARSISDRALRSA